MISPEMRRFLRTPRGQLALIGVTFAGSIALAAFVATQRSFFEKYVREKYESPAAYIVEIGKKLESDEDVRVVKDLSRADHLKLYEAWMQSNDTWPAAAARVMIASSPTLYLHRAAQTLVGGTPRQRRRAVQFLAASDAAEAKPVLRRALDRARLRREYELADFIQQRIKDRSSSQPSSIKPVLPKKGRE